MHSLSHAFIHSRIHPSIDIRTFPPNHVSSLKVSHVQLVPGTRSCFGSQRTNNNACLSAPQAGQLHIGLCNNDKATIALSSTEHESPRHAEGLQM